MYRFLFYRINYGENGNGNGDAGTILFFVEFPKNRWLFNSGIYLSLILIRS